MNLLVADPPGAPENLNVDTVNKNGVKLSWQKPRKDGGAPITGYVIEMKKATPTAAVPAAAPAGGPPVTAPVAEGAAPGEEGEASVEGKKPTEGEEVPKAAEIARAARPARAPADDDKEEWVPVQKTSDLCAWIPMKQGDTGKFRVRAVNEEGPGEPSKVTQPLTAVDQLQAPRICTPEECVGGPGTGVGGLKDITLKVR